MASKQELVADLIGHHTTDPLNVPTPTQHGGFRGRVVASPHSQVTIGSCQRNIAEHLVFVAGVGRSTQVE